MLPKADVQLDLGENYYDPLEFVEACSYADELGFRTAWLGDHFMPWFHSGDRSAFVWSVLGAALAKTRNIKLGPLVTPPIGARYHPALIAQASATLDNMYPGRFALGVGTGEALNEAAFWGGRWPIWEERIERLVEGMKLIQRLWKEERPFSDDGKYFGAPFYYLYTRPKTEIPTYCSAIGKKTAYFAGLYAKNLVTVAPRNNLQRLEDEILPAFRKGAKDAGRENSGVVVTLIFSFKDPSDVVKESWREIGSMLKDSWSLPDPVVAEESGRRIVVEDVKRNMYFCKGWNDLTRVIQTFIDVGIDQFVLVSNADKKRIREIAENVLSVF